MGIKTPVSPELEDRRVEDIINVPKAGSAASDFSFPLF